MQKELLPEAFCELNVFLIFLPYKLAVTLVLNKHMRTLNSVS